MFNKKTSGYIIYRGPSMLDAQPIVVVAIVKSDNVKTGNMVQTYIMVDNGESPVVNAKNLLDVSICGSCPHRRGLGGSCYVNLGQGPRAVADGIKRGIYPEKPLHARIACRDRYVRLGTYGDPMAVPIWVWSSLLAECAGHTGYTHQWQTQGRDFRHLVMASVDTPEQREHAHALGYRTFRVMPADGERETGEMVCPASKEAGRKLTCEECRSCGGNANHAKRDVVIAVHGTLAKRFNIAQG